MNDEPALEDLVSLWQRRRAAAERATPAELCRERPELLPELERRIAVLERMNDLARATPATATLDTACSPPATRSGPHAVPEIPGYEILGELGRGGMGVVYQARQTKLNRVVGLKMILAGGHAGAADLARFRAEAKAIARLQHPNIVQVHEIGEHEGKPFFSLEFCAGGALDKKLAGTPLPPREAARLVQTLARAMHAAHQASVIHRDLKPANVLLTADGTPKITDFGLAKKVGEAGRTSTGDVMGTPSYMAPEQALGKSQEIAATTDVYALGAILYECLSGRPPFKAATSLDTIMQVVSDEPVPPSRFQPKTPRDVQTICLKCLQKEPARRYSSAAALAEDLERFLRDEPIQARPAGRVERVVKWARRRPAAAGLLAVSGLAVLVILAGLAFFTSRLNQRNSDLGEALKRAEDESDAKDQALKTAREAREDAETARRVTQRNLYFAEMNLAGQMAQSNGRGASFLDELLSHWRPARGEPDQRGWEWYSLRSLFPRPQLTLHRHHDDVAAVCWSPDGQRLASASADQTVMLWDAQTGQHLKTLRGHTKQVRALAWCSDGRTLASGDAAGVVRLWDAKTGQARREFRHDAGVYGVSFSPDGTQLASGGQDRKVTVWDTQGGESRFSLQGTTWIKCVGFSRDGTQLAGGCDDGRLHVWNLATRKRVTLPGHPGAWVAGLSWAPDGHRLACTLLDDPPNPRISIWDTDSGQLIMSLTGQAGGSRSVDWSPDGRYLATGDDEQTVRIWEPKTGRMLALVQIQGKKAGVRSVKWSPDGARLAAAGQDQTVKVWDAAELLSYSAALEALPEIRAVRWSPDSQILALGGRDGVVRLWDPTRRHMATLDEQPGSVRDLAWHPDGRRLAVSSDRPEIIIWEVHAKQVIARLIGHKAAVSSVAWSHDGRWLASASTDGTVRVWDATRQTERHKFEGHVRFIHVVCWSPDDHYLASSTANVDDATVRIWDVNAGRQLYQMNGWYYAISWSPKDGRLALPTRLWDTQTRRETVSLRGHTSLVSALAWSPDGQRLASGASDQTVRIWDPDTGRQIVTLPAQNQMKGALNWSHDGRWLTNVGEDGKVRLWDALPGYLAERSPLALPELERRLRTNPRSAPDLLLRAEVHARAGKWQEAAADWNEASRVQPANPPWFIGGWWVAGPFPATFEAAEETATDIDPVRQPAEAPATGESSALRWRPADTSTDGCLDLSALLPHRQKKECACVLVRLYSPREELVTAQLDSTGEMRLRVNGALVKGIRSRVEREPPQPGEGCRL